ncbi:hypothetical protein [Bacillus sp. CGMCC 1.16541]|uniref:hypothetical protein n=1 Tax=Bacillus sp. CGMCC 1.16541 TaxID=2185143 RepID=UPI000D732AD4|nr:hypothetical protein [Bacillus sp. CGMCC 1.16541]
MKTYELAKQLTVLKDVYASVGKAKHKREVAQLAKVIEQLISAPDQPLELLLKSERMELKTTNKRSQKLTFEQNLEHLLRKQYNQLQGTKIKYEDMNTREEVLVFFEYTDAAILKQTTMMDLKLLYSMLTGEKSELKGKKKEDLVRKIRLNIHASRRGEAFLNR